MNDAQKYIQESTNGNVYNRGKIREIAIEAIRKQREETRRNAIEVYKYTCPSRNNRGCMSYTHSQETKHSKCDGNCARIKLFNNLLDRKEL